MASLVNSSKPSRKVRIVAKIRGLKDQEFEYIVENSVPQISVFKHAEGELDEKVTVSFGDQPACRKNVYDMDYCYGQDDDLGLIFTKEIKPLISGVMDGRKATIIAFGARGSGKTYTIQGSVDKPGLATLAMSEILSMAEENHKLVVVSLYEVCQDMIFDVLDPKGKKVEVYRDAQGNTELRGISEVPINSISEFQKLYYSNSSGTRKAPEKIGLKVGRKCHKGLMIHVLSNGESSNAKLVGKMNFVDLAGYEDARRNTTDSTHIGEIANINKSLYALLNVVYALNTNESRVPYRESKLSRILQDSFGASSSVLLLTCLNPFCRDAMYTVSLASRSINSSNQVSDSVIRSSTSKLAQLSAKTQKPTFLSATTKKENVDSKIRSSRIPAKLVQSSVKIRKLPLASVTTYKEKKSQVRLNKQNDATNGRKLFDDVIPTTTSEKAKLVPVDGCSAIILNEDLASSPKKEEDTTADVSVEIPDSTNEIEKVACPLVADLKASTPVEKKSDTTEKENKNFQKSPPLSARLRELSDTLKSLNSSTPSSMMIQHDITIPFSQLSCYEPQTPITEHNPREVFNNRSSGIKQSLVKDCLQFLNTADKNELKGLKSIGEKRANYILELREQSPEPFKNLDDLQDIGLSAKQVKGMMKHIAGDLFN